MGLLKHQLDRRPDRSVAPEDSKNLLRPEKFSGGNIPAETARTAQSLCFCQIGLASPQRSLSLLAVLDVGRRSIPLDDISELVPQRHYAQQEPPIFPVNPPQARFLLERLSSRQRCAPLLHQRCAVLGMPRSRPAPALYVLQRETRIFEQTLIAEVDRAVRQSAPNQRRDCVDNEPKLLFGV